MPLVRHAHTADKISTGVQVMNLGQEPAWLRLELRDQGNSPLPFAGDQCALLPPLASFTWYMPALTGFPAGSYGSAVVHGSQSLAAIVNEAATSGEMDAVIFNGIPTTPWSDAADPVAVCEGFVSLDAAAGLPSPPTAPDVAADPALNVRGAPVIKTSAPRFLPRSPMSLSR